MIFNAALLVGLAVAVYIYGFHLDHFSEEELIRLTPAWFLPLVYGIHGKLALRHSGRQKKESYQERLKQAMGEAAGGGSWMPGNPHLAALLATAVWGVLLWLFLILIFPLL